MQFTIQSHRLNQSETEIAGIASTASEASQIIKALASKNNNWNALYFSVKVNGQPICWVMSRKEANGLAQTIAAKLA